MKYVRITDQKSHNLLLEFTKDGHAVRGPRSEQGLTRAFRQISRRPNFRHIELVEIYSFDLPHLKTPTEHSVRLLWNSVGFHYSKTLQTCNYVAVLSWGALKILACNIFMY